LFLSSVGHAQGEKEADVTGGGKAAAMIGNITSAGKDITSGTVEDTRLVEQMFGYFLLCYMFVFLCAELER
jgi:hypothetical protein